jgi:hypothetical protein
MIINQFVLTKKQLVEIIMLAIRELGNQPTDIKVEQWLAENYLPIMKEAK